MKSIKEEIIKQFNVKIDSSKYEVKAIKASPSGVYIIVCDMFGKTTFIKG